MKKMWNLIKKKKRKRNGNIKGRKNNDNTSWIESSHRIQFIGSNPTKSNPVDEIGRRSHEAKQSTYIVK